MTSATARDRILDAARRLFAAKGYGSTSIADIRVCADVNSGSLYHAYPGKQELLLAVLESYRAGIAPMLLEPAWSGITDPLEQVFALLDAYRVALADSDCSYGCPIGSLALELHEPDPPVRTALAANFTAWSSAVTDCLGSMGIADPRQVADFVLVVMEGGVMLARTYRDIGYFDRAIDQLRTHLRALIQEQRP